MSEFLWSQRQDIGPSPRGGHALAYDAQRKRTVLFGGLGPNGPLADTWEWDGSFWTQVADTGPSPRWMHGLAYDGARTILYGGATPDAPQPDIVHGDTWEWDGAHWTQLADTGPSARAASPLVHASDGDTLILFGGWASAGFSNDTWSFSQGSWTQVSDTGPSARAGHALGADANARIVLFGGADSTTAKADTWAWDAGAWHQIQDIGPAARNAAVGAGRFVVFGGAAGGFRAPTSLFADTWSWDATLWTQTQDFGPPARWASAAALDADRSCLVLFGGFAAPNSTDPEASSLADTWEAAVGAPAPPPQQGTGGLTLTVPGAFSLGSDVGFVQFQLSQPTTSPQKVVVTVNGVTSATGSPSVPQGGATGFALFSLGALPAGSVTVTVAVGSASAQASVSLVPGTPLGALSVTPQTVGAGGSIAATVAVAAPQPVARTVQIVGLESALAILAPLTIPAGAQGNVSVPITIPPTTPADGYDLIAIESLSGAFVVSGPASFTVQ